MTTAAEAFCEIDTQVAQARRALDNGGDRKTATAHLGAIQMLAQNGLRESLANEPKLEAYSKMEAAATKMAEFLTMWRDCLAGVEMSEKDFIGTSGLNEYRAAIANATKPNTGEPT